MAVYRSSIRLTYRSESLPVKESDFSYLQAELKFLHKVERETSKKPKNKQSYIKMQWASSFNYKNKSEVDSPCSQQD